LFSIKWDEYVANWEAAVAMAAGPEEDRRKKEWEALLKEIAIKQGKTLDKFCEEFLEDLKAKSPMGATFDPMVDNPAAIMINLEWWIDNCVANDMLDDIFDDKTIGAWNFFKDTIGIDYSAIYARWRTAPELFIPVQALHRDITPIVDLYNEAVRTYIFGLTVSSVAMCRALLEHVLEKHYRSQGKTLGQLISFAGKKHDHLKRLNLWDKKEDANKVLHRYEERAKEYENGAKNLDKAALDFLIALRDVVTRIPSP
jgi:hypothetical protein